MNFDAMWKELQEITGKYRGGLPFPYDVNEIEKDLIRILELVDELGKILELGDALNAHSYSGT